ncbi:hypothetical protein ENUP19_0085G0129 [Entamoeba nuttalli]|uniref:Ankyrin repeat/GTPase-activator domain containing protein n=2 Tax=Entamoeba nuttalli TaxID=412467 RepID=K2GTI9_ENTNP|nr:ankyrin repeat/GTPase-activator domain containing protein [Entamoeba nuttalli P19]EKE38373.1 ankyrin repeat/GTPase-activator domain containing protein [Entamoeba nuttalli P19]|eukprot:XP_008859294.1 ankyrin repeat/GTPase-activator domain containing protein [Entamoeba nuttalli P19]
MSEENLSLSDLLEQILCSKGSIKVIRKMYETTQSEGTSISFIRDLLCFFEGRNKTLIFMNRLFEQWINGNENLLFVIRKNFWSYNCFTVYLTCSNLVEYLQTILTPFFDSLQRKEEEPIKSLLIESKELKQKEINQLKFKNIESNEVKNLFIKPDLSQIPISQLNTLIQFIIDKLEMIINSFIQSVDRFPPQIGFLFYTLRLKIINGYPSSMNSFLLYLIQESIITPFLSSPSFFGMLEQVTSKQLFIINICIYLLRNISLNTQISSGYFSLFNDFIAFQHIKITTLFLNVICTKYQNESHYIIPEEHFQKVCYSLSKLFISHGNILEQTFIQKLPSIGLSEILKRLKDSCKARKKIYKDKFRPIIPKAPFQYFGKKYESLEIMYKNKFIGLSSRTLSTNLKSKKINHAIKILNQNENYINYIDPKTGLTPLMVACKNPSIELFKTLLTKSPDVFIRDFRGWSVVHHAIYEDKVEFLSLLINYPFYNLFDWNDDMNTPLHYIVQKPLTNEVEKCIIQCLKNGANINSLNLSKETPLYRAVKKNNINMVKYLLPLGADPFIKCVTGSVYDFVLEDPPESELRNIIFDFVKKGTLFNKEYIKINREQYHVHFSIQEYSNINFIINSIQEQNSLLFENLLDRSTFENDVLLTNGNTLLHEISRNGNSEIMEIYCRKKLLLNNLTTPIHIVKLNNTGETPLMVALKSNRADCALMLLSLNIDNLSETIHPETRRNALHYLSISDISVELKKVLFLSLFIRITNINQQDKDGNTCLHLLLKKKEDVSLTELLLNNGADMFIENKKRQQCIHISIENKDVINFNFLFEHEYDWCDDDFEFIHTLYSQDSLLLIPHVINYLNSITSSSPVHRWEIVLKIKRLLDSSHLFSDSILVSPSSYIHSFIQWLAIKYESETLKNQLKECLMDDEKVEENLQEDHIRNHINQGLALGIHDCKILKISLEMLQENLSRCLEIQNSLVKNDFRYDKAILTRLVKKLYFATQQANAQYYSN